LPISSQPTAAAPERGAAALAPELVAAALALGLLASALGLSLRGTALAALAYVVLAMLVGRTFARAAPHRGFGWPNRATLLRATIVCALVAACIDAPRALNVGILALAAVLLDLVDGWLARRVGPASAFGARFDMEVDAALVLVLGALLLANGVAGAWVLAIGAARYAFVAAGRFMPVLAAPLPPSARRRISAAFVMVVLALALLPFYPSWFATGLAVAALIATLGSFAIDIRLLLARGR
jgi:phosphatidylglycerophosphate synthase